MEIVGAFLLGGAITIGVVAFIFIIMLGKAMNH